MVYVVSSDGVEEADSVAGADEADDNEGGGVSSVSESKSFSSVYVPSASLTRPFFRREEMLDGQRVMFERLLLRRDTLGAFGWFTREDAAGVAGSFAKSSLQSVWWRRK